MRRPCGAVGASALISAAITAFYDVQRSRGDDFFIYPDYFLFHVGARWATTAGWTSGRGARRWWSRTTPSAMLEAIDDRGDHAPAGGGRPAGRARARAGAGGRARGRGSGPAWPTPRRAGWRTPTCASRATRSPRATWRRCSIRRRAWPGCAPRAAARCARPRSSCAPGSRAGGAPRDRPARRELVEDGVPVESYRRIDLDEALGAPRLTAHPGGDISPAGPRFPSLKAEVRPCHL